MKEFEECSGLRLNTKKCVCLDDPVTTNLTSHTNIKDFAIAETIKYLGIHIPLIQKTEIHQTPWEKFTSRLDKWKVYFSGSGVSAPGRSRLLNSYVSSVVTYHLFFDTPSSEQCSLFDKHVPKMISRNGLGFRKDLWRPAICDGGIGFWPMSELSDFYKAWWIERWKSLKKHNNWSTPEWIAEMKTQVSFQNFSFCKDWYNKYKQCYLDKCTDPKVKNPRPMKFLKTVKTLNANTAGNSKLLDEMGYDIDEIFPKVKTMKLPNRLKNFLWELYHGRLPIYCGSLCHFCGNLSSGNHMYRCKSIRKIIEAMIKYQNGAAEHNEHIEEASLALD